MDVTLSSQQAFARPDRRDGGLTQTDEPIGPANPNAPPILADAQRSGVRLHRRREGESTSSGCASQGGFGGTLHLRIRPRRSLPQVDHPLCTTLLGAQQLAELQVGFLMVRHPA